MSRARDLSKLANPEVFSVDTINNVGVNTLTPGVKFDVVGVVSATTFNGDGSQLTGIIDGATLSASSGTQRLVVTSQTTGSMTQAATNSDITYDTATSTLSATQFSGTILGNSTGLQGTPDITVRNVTGVAATFTGQIKSTNVAYGFNSSAESFPFTSDSNLGNGAKAFYAKHTGSGQSNNYYFYGENSGGETFSVTTSGTLTAAGTIKSGTTGVAAGTYGGVFGVSQGNRARIQLYANTTAEPAIQILTAANDATTKNEVFSVINDGSITSAGSITVTGTGQYYGGQRGGIWTHTITGSSYTMNLNSANNWAFPLNGNKTLSNPSNQVAGQHGVVSLVQDGTGGRTVSFGSNWKFPGGTAPTLSTAANAQDLLAYYVAASGTIYAQLILDLK